MKENIHPNYHEAEFECACGNKIDNAAHNFSSWKIVSEDANGKKEERVCETCKYKETKVSDCEHNYVDEKQESTCTVKGYEKSTCSKCGHIKENKELILYNKYKIILI
ncbi:50S ribosomal protein L31 [uncultured Methanobrevibacter sp.]|uniref:50S ribosomal protein L31 n=1 Tax=uncultured Methanobrevibacter sp. TaxID=253161 RepID=UPI002610AFB2|nr:50S ribosomal protein L31 [uncultured Methanobrevibacter sp.]